MAAKSSSRGYEVNFVKKPPNEIETNCPICLDVLLDPKLATCCGHSFCANCVGNWEEEGKPCPLCNKQIKLVNDKRLARILNGYKVYCPNKDKGCEWTGELGQLEDHLNHRNPRLGCQFEEVQCGSCQNYQCERRLLSHHISNECLNHNVECEYRYIGCEFKNPRRELRAHIKDCVDVHLSLMAKYMKSSLSRKDREIEQLRNELQQQREENTVQVQELKQQHEEFSESMQQLRRELQNPVQNVKPQHKFVLNQHWILMMLMFLVLVSIDAYLYQLIQSSDTSEVKQMARIKFKYLKKQVDVLQDTSDRKFEEIQKQIAIKFQHMEREIQLLGEQVDFPVLPVNIKLTHMTEHRKQGSPWLSMPFYTHQEGYKMRLVVYPNGIKSGSETHISVGVFLMSGKHDDHLNWPLNVTLTVTLLHENNVMIYATVEFSSHMHGNDVIGRVWNSTMAESGLVYPEFARHNQLHLYTKFDTIYFRVDTKAGDP